LAFSIAELHIIDYNITSGQQIALDARIAQGMEENGDLTEALKAIKNVADDTSWFRDTPHYWASASLPLAYAVACVEAVSKKSESESCLMRARMDTAHTRKAKAVPQTSVALLE